MNGGAQSELRLQLQQVSEVAGLPRQPLSPKRPVTPDRAGDVSPVPSAREQLASFLDPESPIGSEVTTVSHGRSTEAASEYLPPFVNREDLSLRSPPDLGFVASPIQTPKNPVFSPLPYTALSSAEVQRMLKRSQTASSSARQLFP